MNDDVVISVESLSKRYLVGHQGPQERYHSLRDSIVRHGKNFARKTLDMARGRQIIQGDSVEEFWALKDVSFEVKRGEVLGIIGRNGAGKSTLLKILSRITEPTEGRVRIKGRVASLLEVGTGFHPELSGRENIFLNGAILGMTRAEIKSKFDEIVDFAGVEKFLDTPVKRYSSGMYVRLAFAVAAHLESEILVVDEVLAVGDAEFQKKCLGKMQSVAEGGRTVFFVSHNMGVVQSLTKNSLWLNDGQLFEIGETKKVVGNYVGSAHSSFSDDVELSPRISPDQGEKVRLLKITPFPTNGSTFYFDEDIIFDVSISSKINKIDLRLGITIFDASGSAILSTFTPTNLEVKVDSVVRCRAILCDTRLAPGSYSLAMSIGEGGRSNARKEYDVVRSGPRFSIASISSTGASLYKWSQDYGFIVHSNAKLELTGEKKDK